MIESSSRGILGETYGRRGIGLGIAIDEKSGLFGNGEAGSQIHCRGGLSDPAFLVCHGDDSSQIIFPERKSNKASLRMQDVSRGTYLLGGDSDVSAPIVPCETFGDCLHSSPPSPLAKCFQVHALVDRAFFVPTSKRRCKEWGTWMGSRH